MNKNHIFWDKKKLKRKVFAKATPTNNLSPPMKF
jgi:hypothetical protein